LLTCKEFLHELNDYLEDVLDPASREELRKHINECPNCWVVCDTTQRTLKIYKGMEAQAVPENVQSRLMEAIRKKISEGCGSSNKAKC
jgi:anti-sigma factor (TIGR02949 family)